MGQHGVVADLRPFRALRPSGEVAARVLAPPYDVVDVGEARGLAADNPDSFLHVSRPEIDLPDGVRGDSPEVHEAGRAALRGLVDRGVLVADAAPTYSVYRLARDGHVQTGLVACAAVADYREGRIATHEQTRRDKEDDRVHHLEALAAHDEPVFLLVAPGEPSWAPVAALVERVTTRDADVDVTAPDGVRHTVWRVEDPIEVAGLAAAVTDIPVLYVADGHHRSAAADRVAGESGGLPADGGAGTDVFPVVVFPGEALAVLPYNRVVADLGGHAPDDFLVALAGDFTVERLEPGSDPTPRERGELAMRVDGAWHRLTLRRPDTEPGDAADPVAALDVSALQEHVLRPLLQITDVRSDPRIGFVGGIRGAAELERLADSGGWAAAFLLHPTSVEELVAVAGSGRDMPPKSTWFEPKLGSGLFVHPFADPA